jgi:hypothetical protein
MLRAANVVCALQLLTAATAAALPVAAVVAGASLVTACDDENDPKTWVKRLDDPAQRARAIERLGQFYEDGMTKAGNNQNDPAIKELLDTIIDPMTKAYTAGGLDDKTRVDLMKFLAETHDPRTQPAIAKALSSFEMGKTDDEVRVSCESVTAMVKNGVKIDQSVADGLWTVFVGFKLSKTNSQRLYQGLHDAILAVKDPSYGDKAIDKLKAPIPPNPSVDDQKDLLMWWQPTCVQVISDLQYKKAIHPLIVALLTPSKTASLGAKIQFALLKMAKDAEPELIKALNGSDPDYAAQGPWDDKTNIGVIAEVLAIIGRPAGRDAILAALPSADTGTARTELAQALTQMPDDNKTEGAFLDTYKKIPWDDQDTLLGALSPRIALAQQSAKFYDPKLVPWLIKEMKGAPDYSARIVQLEAEAKLMTPDTQDDVAATLPGVKKETPADGYAKVQAMYDAMNSALSKCKTDSSCYLSILDEPIPVSPSTAYYKQVKATWMAVIYGSGNAAATRSALVAKLPKVTNTGARIAMCEAIDELTPNGDAATADALQKIVDADTKAGDANLIATDNTVEQVSWRLRVRGQ